MAPSAAAALLHLIPTRRATYNKSRKGAQRALNWPFPLAASAAKRSPSTIHPDHLAAAGFHSTPTAEQPTRSTCFLCEVIVEEWAEGDEPLDVHLELNEQCGWAVLQTILTRWVDGLREKKEWNGAWGHRGEWWPKSDYMISARQASFDKGWPHEGEKGVPSKEEIAAAGWFFAPGRDGDSDDQCICPFCTRTVEGWEEGDDPIALHKRKLGLKCPFFLAPQPVVQAVAQEEEEEEVAEPEPIVEEEPLKPKMSRSKGRTKLAQRDDEDQVEEEPQSQPVRASRRTKTTAPSSDGPETSVVGSAVKPSRATRGKKAPPSVVEEPEEEEEEETASQSQPTRSHRSTQPEVIVEVVPKPSKTKGKAVKNKKAAPAVAEEELEPEDGEEEEVEAIAMEQDDEEAPVEEPALATKQSKKKASTRSTASATLAKSRTRTIKTKAPSKGSFVVAEDQDLDDEEQLADAARVAAEFLDEQEDMHVVQEEQDAPKTKAKAKAPATKSKKSKAATTKSKSKKAAPIQVAEDEPLEQEEPVATINHQQQQQRGPLTPTVASPSPRPIRSLPSKINSPAGSRSTSGSTVPLRANSNSTTTTTTSSTTTPAPISLSTTYAPPPNPFLLPSGVSLPPPTPAEMNLSLAEWYDLCGRTVHEEMEREMEKEMQTLEDRVEEGRKELRRMIEAAKRREAVSPRKMRG